MHRHTLDKVELASFGGLGAVDIAEPLIWDLATSAEQELQLTYEDLNGGMARVVLRPQLEERRQDLRGYIYGSHVHECSQA